MAVGPGRSRELRRVRSVAVAASLAPAASVAEAVATHGFVQYDPIRRPARAQDLVLAQRVRGYRVGDLDRCYPDLPLDEDLLHAYGVMPEAVVDLLHPRPDRKRGGRPYAPSGLAADVLAVFGHGGPVHPRELAERFGRQRAVNDWGGYSAATTRALEELHYHGLLRVARRENGVKVYEARRRPPGGGPADERLRQLALLVARLLAPVQEPTLRRTVARFDEASGGTGGRRAAVDALVERGELAARVVDGVTYLAPPATWDGAGAVGRRVRFLAPFDPVVWDRRRFEHLWGWEYRFEAYTPPAKRRFGYYAMPVLRGDEAVGWANCTVTASGSLDVDLGFADRPPTARDFWSGVDREAARLAGMLGVAAPGAGGPPAQALARPPAVSPPSMTNDWPVAKADSGDAR